MADYERRSNGPPRGGGGGGRKRRYRGLFGLSLSTYWETLWLLMNGFFVR